MSSPKILILTGPNLNLLGTREPAVYGTQTLGDIEEMCADRTETLGLSLDFRQSNHEGELVEWIQAARETCAGIVINGAAYSHTSVAIHDALKLTGLPVIEVHLSNIYKREEFRHHSYISSVAEGVICGLGAQGYLFAIEAMSRLLDKK
jgi:3-dehydroquinate dehydratase-2